MKCEMCGKTSPKVGNRIVEVGGIIAETELCDDCFHETEGDEKQMEREQREEW